MAQFIELKSDNPLLKQPEAAKKLGSSSSFLQRYRQDINTLPPHRTPSSSHKRKQKISTREHDLERP